MAAPTATARITPTGFKMGDGFKITVAFSKKPNVQLWESTVKPPGIDGGTPIDTTTQHNVTYRTKAARKLKDYTDGSFKAAYDPDVYDDLISLINDDTGSFTIHWPDGTADSFWGYLGKADFEDLEEGKFPMGNFTLIVTNWDPVNFVEAGPLHQEAAGT